MNIPENFDRWMFDYMEGNLSLSEVEEFEQFLLQNPDFELDADAWSTATIPNESIVYPNQHKLERKPILLGWLSWSAAAFLLLLVGIGGYLSMNSNSIESTKNLIQFNNSSKQQKVGAINRSADTDTSENELAVTANASFAANVQQTNAPNPKSISNRQSADLAVIQNRTNGSTEGDEAYDYLKASKMVSATINQAKSKYDNDTHQSQYVHNPSASAKDFDLSKATNINYGSFSFKLKKLYRKIEKMVGYETGIVNLRDPDLLMPENSVLASNPGFVGGMLKPRFEMKYRNQWLGSDMNAQKSQFSFDNYVPQIRSGVGITINSNTYGNGAFGDHSIDLSFSPKIVISKDVVFEPGINVSLGLLTGNTSKLINTPNLEMDRGLIVQNNFEILSSQIDKKWYKDYGLGFVLNTTWFYAGFSLDNLGNHYASVYRSEGNLNPEITPVLYNAVIGYDWEHDNKRSSISPFVSYRQFGELKEAWAGVTFRLNHFTIGGSYSTLQNYTGSIGMKFNNFKLVYQYDQTQTLLTNERIASHNIGMRFTIDSKNKKARFN